MIKRQGSILVETVIALFVLLICSQISLKISIDMYKSVSIRKSTILLREGLNSVCSDIKYNVAFDDINSILQSAQYQILYDDKFNEKMLENKLLDMDISNDDENYIRIGIIDYKEGQLKINVIGKYKGVEMEQIINKAPWMDEV